ncbi:unnamed protein product [Onchocerca flexuosa]|uniref:Secreted protein n=1 Tax=Onchocerca flexuosa TaxID=387005 RepID=A0A183H0Z6_9BILA|nr:unnamed protein product [Onchocerca flexuosa]
MKPRIKCYLIMKSALNGTLSCQHYATDTNSQNCHKIEERKSKNAKKNWVIFSALWDRMKKKKIWQKTSHSPLCSLFASNHQFTP